jgi:tetratricopeptide (TPR) repeat protein
MAGQLDEAVNVHEEMLRVFRGHALSHFELGKLYEQMMRPKDAIREYELFLEMWSEVDEGLPQVEYAEKRLVALRE